MSDSKITHRVQLGIVIVSFGHAKEVLRLLESLLQQVQKGDKLVVVDNKKPYELQNKLKKFKVDLVPHDNGGFGAGCNFGAAKLINDVDALLFLNPDTYIQQIDYLEKMRAGFHRFAAWQSLLLLPDGKINSAGNTYHITGLSWTDKYGSTDYPGEDFEAKTLSGACLAVRKDWWIKVGGFTEEYFLYGEDLDLATKIAMAGGKLGVLSGARIYHDYDYSKGRLKWMYIERNRLANMLINWPSSLIFLTLIPNLLFNIVIFFHYTLRGMVITKIKADIEFIKMIPTCLRLRANHRDLNQITSKEFLKLLDYKINTPLLGLISNNKIVNGSLGVYYSILRLFMR